QRHEARYQHAQRQIDEADMDAWADIGSLDIAIIDAEGEDQPDLGDEQKTEEEGQAAQRFLSAFLERQVIDLIDDRAEREEHRQHDDAGDDRIDAETGAEKIGDVRAENDETRMRDVDDIEHAEGNRDAGGDRGVE